MYLTCMLFYRTFNNVEITVIVIQFQIYQIFLVFISQNNVTISELIDALTHLHTSVLTEPAVASVLLGDFNVNLM